jgi:hypothetical protein
VIAPPWPEPPALGPLATPSEEELASASDALHEEALALAWAAVALGTQPSRLLGLAAAGELLVVPGPWPLRQSYGPGLGCFVPAWQIENRTHSLHPGIPELVDAGVERGWSSLRLHRVMTAPPWPGAATPAELFQAGDVEEALAQLPGAKAGRALAGAR